MEFTKREYQQFCHGISMSLLSKKSAQKWRYDDETAEEIRFLEGLESKVLDKIRQADTPQTDCETCKWGEWYRNGRDITTMDDECGGCCSWNNKWTPKEPQTDCPTCKWWSSYGYCVHRECKGYEPQERSE